MNGRKAMKRKEIYAGGLKSARESRLGKLAAAMAVFSLLLGGCGGQGDQAKGGSDIQEVDLAEYMSDASKWEDDGGDYTLTGDKLTFNNAYYGDFCAVRLNEEFQDVTVKFTLQLTAIAADVSEEDGTWWDTEFLCLVRSNFAGSAYVEGEEGQAGYCITSWGDMNQFALGRSGYDDVFGIYDWPLGDGKPHQIQFTVDNNEDNTVITLKVVVDGQEIAVAEDDGSQVKKDRISFFPEAGGITLRCKYLGAEITGAESN